MKEIPYIQFTAAIPASESPTKEEIPAQTTATLLTLALNIPPQDGAGFTPALMRARNRVEDAMSSAEVGGVIKLEDADYATAQDAVKAVRWGRRDRHLLKFVELFGL